MTLTLQIKMRCTLIKTLLKELSYPGNAKGLPNVGRNVAARYLSTETSLTQEMKTQQNPEVNKTDPLQHEDFFNVRELVTVKDLFLNRAHYGHVIGCRNNYMTPYLFGSRSGIDIFDLEQTVEHFQDALNFAAHIAYRKGIILFVDRSKMTMPFVEKTAKDCGEYAHCRYWSPGIFTDMVNRLGQNIRLPDLVIFLNTQNSVFQSHRAVTDCAKMLIPTIGIVDSNCDPRLISYPIPANDDTFITKMYYLKLFETAIMRGKSARL